MIKFDVMNRFNDKVQFTAEIDCAEDAALSLKLGLAVRWAIKSRADLTGADLTGAYLSGANLMGADLTGAYLSGADLMGANLTRASLSGANLTRADLMGAYLSGANLMGADLTRAYLSGADLTRADLTGADLTRADLTRADLTRADLTGAVGLKHEQTHPLASLKYMTVPLQAFKVVAANGEGHINGGIKYEIGKRASVDNASTDPLQTCAAGIHVADLPWCLREFQEGCRILLVDHSVDDIACVPLATDGKYRLHGCTPIKDITDDLKAAGVI